MTDKIFIQNLKEKYGKIIKLTSDDQSITVYCKMPTFEIYQKYQNL